MGEREGVSEISLLSGSLGREKCYATLPENIEIPFCEFLIKKCNDRTLLGDLRDVTQAWSVAEASQNPIFAGVKRTSHDC